MSDSPVTVLIVGAGARGEIYARYALEHPERMQVVAVAEPRRAYRRLLAERHAIPPERVWHDWRDALAQGRVADAVFICTPDNEHTAPALEFARQGYDMLLEKPLSPQEDDCREIVRVAQANGILFAVAHVLRYTCYTQTLKALLADRAIGELISLQHLEPVGWWHQAHSFVRGNWRNTNEAAFMLLAKSCHDIDWIQYVMDAPCEAVSSFGNLSHFTPENEPAGAAARCTECAMETEAACPYSALKIYTGEPPFCTPGFLSVLTPDPTTENILNALKTGPYGHCVYRCDNNVVDHQVVNMLFAGGKTASFTMTAFTPMAERQTRLFGSHGCIEGDGRFLRVRCFATNQETVYDTQADAPPTQLAGHSGGDLALVARFIDAVSQRSPGYILSGPQATLESHRVVFAAERSRRQGQTIHLSQE